MTLSLLLLILSPLMLAGARCLSLALTDLAWLLFGTAGGAAQPRRAAMPSPRAW